MTAAKALVSEWNRMGSQMRFFVGTLAGIPDALMHYRGELLRVIAQMGLGTGVLAVIGGTVAIVGFLAMTTGAIVAVQGYNQFASVGVEALTGFASAFFNTREIQPGTVMVALAATVGAGTTAALGAMRINEEIDALEVIGIRSISYLASTRVLAGVVVAVPLFCVGLMTAYLAARVGTTAIYGQGSGVYDHYFNTFLRPTDVLWSSVEVVVVALAAVTGQLQTHDSAVGDLIDRGGPALGETRQLLERLQPTVPILLANLVSVGQVALTYHNDIEQLLVVFPMAIAAEQAGILANLNTKQAYRGQYLSFNLNLNLPPPCTTGFLPAQQRRIPTFEDYPDRPAGDLYCRVPQDSPFNVRGARNIPCETVPGKRAPTVKLCESDEPYLPLNDGYNWKGDPNATVPGLGSGQDIPQTWQTMLLPPGS